MESQKIAHVIMQMVTCGQDPAVIKHAIGLDPLCCISDGRGGCFFGGFSTAWLNAHSGTTRTDRLNNFLNHHRHELSQEVVELVELVIVAILITGNNKT